MSFALAANPHRITARELLLSLRDRYLGQPRFAKLVAPYDIRILSDFLSNWDRIEEFYLLHYSNRFPKTVLCGFNPGRLGAGKTGGPFVDFSSLSKMLSSVSRKDSERTAQFFFDVVQQFGTERFYNSFYVTNVSWVGYARGRKNLNYPDLPPQALAFVEDTFRWEMEQVAPCRIISLGGGVQKTVATLFAASPEVDTSLQLPHPNYCAFPSNRSRCMEEYRTLLSVYCERRH
jgi:hypothetical protein